MKYTIKDESELPNTRQGWTYFVRSKADPYALIDGFTGSVYFRADGKKWRNPAYKFNYEGQVTPVACGAWYDHAEYPYDEQPTNTRKAA